MKFKIDDIVQKSSEEYGVVINIDASPYPYHVRWYCSETDEFLGYLWHEEYQLDLSLKQNRKRKLKDILSS